MRGKAATAAITVFWLTMMGLLAHREILPAWRATREAAETLSYTYLESLAAKPRVSQMGIYLREQRIGFTLSRMRKVADALHLDSRSEMNLSLSPGASSLIGPGMGGSLHVGLRFNARVVSGELVDFRLTVSSPPGTAPAVTVDGQPVGESLHLKIRQGDAVRQETIPFNSKHLISSGLGQTFALPKLRVGARWAIRSLDPATYAVRTAWAKVVGRESLTIEDTTYDAYLVTIPYGGYEVKIWADRDGEILKQKIFGFTFVREDPPADALDRKHL